MKQVRDCVVHAPNELSTSLMSALRNQISPDSIKCILVHFSDKKLIVNLFKWMSTHYAIYDNINAYCKKLNIATTEFDKDRVRLMKLLNAYTYRELNEKIVDLL